MMARNRLVVQDVGGALAAAILIFAACALLSLVVGCAPRDEAAHTYDCIGWCHEYSPGMALELGCTCDGQGGYPTPISIPAIITLPVSPECQNDGDCVWHTGGNVEAKAECDALMARCIAKMYRERGH